MGDLLGAGANWLAAQKRAHCTSTVTYRRGDVSAEVPAEQARAELPIVGDGGQQPQVAVYDQAWWINVSDLADDFGEPQLRDRIEATIAGEAMTFELLQPDGATQPFTQDAFRQRFKVFCKRVQ